MPQHTLAEDERPREALRQACAALDAAEARPQPYAMCRALADLARCYQQLGAPASAEHHLERAVHWGRLAGSTDLVVDLLVDLADAAARLARHADAAQSGSGHAARERARDHAFEAATLAARLADPSCEGRLLMRLSEVLEDCGDHADALSLQVRAVNSRAQRPAQDVRKVAGPEKLADA